MKSNFAIVAALGSTLAMSMLSGCEAHLAVSSEPAASTANARFPASAQMKANQPPPAPSIRYAPLDAHLGDRDADIGTSDDYTVTIIPADVVNKAAPSEHLKQPLVCIETDHGHAFAGRGGITCDWAAAKAPLPAP